MTKRILTVVVLTVFFLGCNKTNQKKEEDSNSQKEVKVLTVSQVMENPDEYLNQNISVEGMVTHVCAHGGKRLHLTESESDEKLRVRAGEETGKFEKELEGSNILITGKFIEERIDEEYIEKLKKGQTAEEHRHEDGQEDEHKHETVEKAESEGQAQGVSEEFIKEMQAKIDSSENGYVSEYWLESIKMEKK